MHGAARVSGTISHACARAHRRSQRWRRHQRGGTWLTGVGAVLMIGSPALMQCSCVQYAGGGGRAGPLVPHSSPSSRPSCAASWRCVSGSCTRGRRPMQAVAAVQHHGQWVLQHAHCDWRRHCMLGSHAVQQTCWQRRRAASTPAPRRAWRAPTPPRVHTLSRKRYVNWQRLKL
jgi:hypothetical protein